MRRHFIVRFTRDFVGLKFIFETDELLYLQINGD